MKSEGRERPNVSRPNAFGYWLLGGTPGPRKHTAWTITAVCRNELEVITRQESYRRRKLVQKNRFEAPAGRVGYIHEPSIHQPRNISSEWSLSLHGRGATRRSRAQRNPLLETIHRLRCRPVRKSSLGTDQCYRTRISAIMRGSNPARQIGCIGRDIGRYRIGLYFLRNQTFEVIRGSLRSHLFGDGDTRRYGLDVDSSEGPTMATRRIRVLPFAADGEADFDGEKAGAARYQRRDRRTRRAGPTPR
jgi:hypothetical protein